MIARLHALTQFACLLLCEVRRSLYFLLLGSDNPQLAYVAIHSLTGLDPRVLGVPFWERLYRVFDWI